MESFNRRPEETLSWRRGQTAEEIYFKRSNVRQNLVTERMMGRSRKRGVRIFSTFEEKVATFDARPKRVSNPGRMRRSTHKFARNHKVNDLYESKFKGYPGKVDTRRVKNRIPRNR